MNTSFLENISPDLIKFILTLVFSLLIGLEQRRHYIEQEEETQFGTDRTFTLIGILGFILYVISPESFYPFLLGAGVLTVLLGIYYYNKIKTKQRFGMTSLVTAF